MSELLQNRNNRLIIPARTNKYTPAYRALKTEWVDKSGVDDAYVEMMIDMGMLIYDPKPEEYIELVGFAKDDKRSHLEKLEYAEKQCGGLGWFLRTYDHKEAAVLAEPKLQEWGQWKPDPDKRAKYNAWKKEQCTKTGEKFEESPKYITSIGKSAEAFLMPLPDPNSPLVQANPHSPIFAGLDWARVINNFHDMPVLIGEGVDILPTLLRRGWGFQRLLFRFPLSTS